MEQKKILGNCPICGKGQIVERDEKYSCDHFKSEDDNCNFEIHKKYSRVILTEKEIKSLLEKKETEVINDFINKEGKKFTAKLVITEGNTVEFDFPKEVLSVKCPQCEGEIHVGGKVYYCEKSHNEENKCEMFLNRTIAGYNLSKLEAELILSKKETDFIAFTSNEGKDFIAKLYLDENYETKFNSEVCACPQCEDGKVRINSKSYYCSNFKKEDMPCDFSIWREHNFSEITPENIILLCDGKQTNDITFKKKGRESYKSKLALGKDFKVL